MEKVERIASETSIRPEEDDDVAGWGSSRKTYYNADAIETEADALEEEQEAIRLQKKQLQGMSEADYGFDEAEWLDAGKSEDQANDSERDGIIQQVLPQLKITDAMGPEEKSKILRMRYPEFEPLAQEFVALKSTHEELQSQISAVQGIKDHKDRTSTDQSRSTMQVLSKYHNQTQYSHCIFSCAEHVFCHCDFRRRRRRWKAQSHRSSKTP